jgi:hypothetical protein
MALRSVFNSVKLTPGDSLTFTGKLQITTSISGGNLYFGWSYLHFGVFNSKGNAGTISNNTWTGGSETGYTGYMIIVPTSASGVSSPWGLGSAGSAGARLTSNTSDWSSQSGNVYGLGGAYQTPESASAGAGVFQFKLKVTRLGPYLTQFDYLVRTASSDDYVLQDTVYDTGHNPDGTVASSVFDTVGIYTNSSCYTDMAIDDLQIAVERGTPTDKNSLYDFESDLSGWTPFQVNGVDQATVSYVTLPAGTVNDEGALGITPSKGGMTWGAKVDMAAASDNFKAILNAWKNSVDLTQYALRFDVTLLVANAAAYTGPVDVYAALESGDNMNVWGIKPGEDAPATTDAWTSNQVLTATLKLSEATLDEAADSMRLIIGTYTEGTGPYVVLIDNVRLVSLDPTPALRQKVASKFFGNIKVASDGTCTSPKAGDLKVSAFPYVYFDQVNTWREGTADYNLGWLWCSGNFATGAWFWDYFTEKWLYSDSNSWPWVYADGLGWRNLANGHNAIVTTYHQSPDALVSLDGKSVTNADEWTKRREEIKKLFEDYEYGQMPAAPDSMQITAGDWTEESSSKTRSQVLTVVMKAGSNTVTTTITVRVPLNPSAAVPVILTPDPWGFYYQMSYLSAGWAGASIDFTEFAPDNTDSRNSGKIYTLFGKEIDTGDLITWAWCYSRVIDVLEQMKYPEIDLGKIAVTGHSRYGKAALITGAFDERIALTAPSHSGSGGAGSFKLWFTGAEPISACAGGEGYWFCPSFSQWVDDVDSMPVDQHLLTGLVAPRGLIQIEGTLDPGTNPRGTQLSYMAAKRVYRMLGAESRLNIRFRPVGHISNDGDVINFANYLWNGTALPAGFDFMPYAIAPDNFTEE